MGLNRNRDASVTAEDQNLCVRPGAGAEEDGFWFAIPPGFISLPVASPLASSGSFGTQELSAVVAPFLCSVSDGATRRRFVTSLTTAHRMLCALWSEGTVHCSLGLHRDDTVNDDGGVLLSFFTITWMNISWAPRAVTAARAVTTAEGHGNIAYDELGCGPVAFSETLRTPRPGSGLPQTPLLQIYAHVPHPDGTSLVLLTLSTTATSHRDAYRTLLRRITERVTFDAPRG
ncbi:hypothetical protein [Streptomyces sp. NPDC004629]|uniref:hypothetical protein n=1 Tax=Streptomyces sp. NPDC004629 TaxID=3364705 RepID=UPI0036AC74C1